MQSIANPDQGPLRVGGAFRREESGHSVGRITIERPPPALMNPSQALLESGRSGGVDLCRLLVAVLGVSVYLGVPTLLLVLIAVQLVS